MPETHSEINQRCNREWASQQSRSESMKQRERSARTLIRLSCGVQIIIRDDAFHARV